MVNLNTYLFVLFCLFIYSYFVSCCDMVNDFLLSKVYGHFANVLFTNF